MLGVAMCSLMAGFLPGDTWLRLILWTLVGIVIYGSTVIATAGCVPRSRLAEGPPESRNGLSATLNLFNAERISPVCSMDFWRCSPPSRCQTAACRVSPNPPVAVRSMYPKTPRTQAEGTCRSPLRLAGQRHADAFRSHCRAVGRPGGGCDRLGGVLRQASVTTAHRPGPAAGRSTRHRPLSGAALSALLRSGSCCDLARCLPACCGRALREATERAR